MRCQRALVARLSRTVLLLVLLPFCTWHFFRAGAGSPTPLSRLATSSLFLLSITVAPTSMSSTVLSSSSGGQPHPARPHGPRTYQRSTSPPPPQPTLPLNIRKASASKPENPSLLAPLNPPLSRSPTPRLALQIPAPSATPGKGKPSLKLAISGASSSRQTSESKVALYGGDYYGGPQTPSVSPPVNDGGVDDATIRPSMSTSRPLSMEDVRRTISDIEVQTRSTPPPPTFPGEEQIDDQPQMEWSDDVFDEVTRLGEGAGGAVHEVRDRRTGKLLARKTITTREAPMKQVVRELALITTIKHRNIIRFYGAYMSPSSSEVKVVMEICQGKSLESVGKRIKERGARVGEKVAGRLAEGVCLYAASMSRPSSPPSRYCRALHTFIQRS
jgi:mitogen-activated protein kinase kinase